MSKREIKFRLPLFDRQGNFVRFAYWGFVDGGFSGITTNNHNYQSTAEGRSQQYTGLKDKNGVGIWEGDIVKSVLRIVPVVWLDDAARWAIEGAWSRNQHHTDLTCDLAENLEVIGSIHTHPELLGKE